MIIIIAFNFVARETAFYFISLFGSSLWLISFLKVAFHNGKPFYTHSAIVQALDCSNLSFGNPSEHAWFASLLPFAFFLQRFYPLDPVDGCTDAEGSPGWARLRYYAWMLLCLFCSFFIGFSTVLLGTHSVNQVIYGWQWGFLMAYTMHFMLQPFVVSHVRWLYCSQGRITGPYSFGHLAVQMICILGIFFASFLIPYEVV